MVRDLRNAGIGNVVEQLLAPRKINQPPVIGIDQVEIPELAALVDVRHTRDGQLQDELRQGSYCRRPRHQPDKIREIGEEGIMARGI